MYLTTQESYQGYAAHALLEGRENQTFLSQLMLPAGCVNLAQHGNLSHIQVATMSVLPALLFILYVQTL